jgi:hypothetical protein
MIDVDLRIMRLKKWEEMRVYSIARGKSRIFVEFYIKFNNGR